MFSILSSLKLISRSFALPILGYYIDKSRKKILLLSIFGTFLLSFINFIVSIINNDTEDNHIISYILLLIGNLIVGITVAFGTNFNSSIADLTSNEDRSTAYSLILLANGLAIGIVRINKI